MKKEKIDRLETKGWKVGSADEFLELTPDESAELELKFAMGKGLGKHQSRLPSDMPPSVEIDI